MGDQGRRASRDSSGSKADMRCSPRRTLGQSRRCSLLAALPVGSPVSIKLYTAEHTDNVSRRRRATHVKCPTRLRSWSLDSRLRQRACASASLNVQSLFELAQIVPSSRLKQSPVKGLLGAGLLQVRTLQLELV